MRGKSKIVPAEQVNCIYGINTIAVLILAFVIQYFIGGIDNTRSTYIGCFIVPV